MTDQTDTIKTTEAAVASSTTEVKATETTEVIAPSKKQSDDVGKTETEADTEKKTEAFDNDESWYGKGPDEEIVKSISDKLGKEVSDLFVKAVRQYDGASNLENTNNVQRLLASTSTFVTMLKKVPEDLQMTTQFGEMSLAYGKALVRYIEIEGTGSTAVASKIVKALQSAVAGGRSEVKEEGREGEVEGEADKKAETENGNGNDDEEDDDNNNDEEDLESAWTQLEVARVIFSQADLNEREAECRYTLGELLMACDEGKQAGSEFSTAVQLFTDNRRKAECCYKQYLAVRNSERTQAVQALTQGVDILKDVADAEKELDEMKTELKDFKETIADEEKEKSTVTPTEVQVVRPKRKRDATATKETKDEANGDKSKKDNETETNGKAEDKKDEQVNGSGKTDGEGDKVKVAEIKESVKVTVKTSGGEGDEERNGKKARIEPVNA